MPDHRYLMLETSSLKGTLPDANLSLYDAGFYATVCVVRPWMPATLMSVPTQCRTTFFLALRYKVLLSEQDDADGGYCLKPHGNSGQSGVEECAAEAAS